MLFSQPRKEMGPAQDENKEGAHLNDMPLAISSANRKFNRSFEISPGVDLTERLPESMESQVPCVKHSKKIFFSQLEADLSAREKKYFNVRTISAPKNRPRSINQRALGAIAPERSF